MRITIGRGAFALLASALFLSCSEPPISPIPRAPVASIVANVPQVVISQLYGGGGNLGATYTNDFVELFNPGRQAGAVTGWSVQSASSAGTTWNVTTLTGTIQPGHYYLVQLARGRVARRGCRRRTQPTRKR